MKSRKKIASLEGELKELEERKGDLKGVLKGLEDEAREVLKQQEDIRVSLFPVPIWTHLKPPLYSDWVSDSTI